MAMEFFHKKPIQIDTDMHMLVSKREGTRGRLPFLVVMAATDKERRVEAA
jgi:hypothetical protein